MGLTPLIPNADDLKRTMGSMPPMIAKPDSGSLPSLDKSSAPAELPPTGLRPIVPSPRQQQEQELQQKISSFENPQKPQGFWQKLGHALAQNPYSVAYRNTMQQNRIGELSGLQNQDLAEKETAAKSQLQSSQADYYKQHGESIGLHPLTADEAAAVGNPDLEGVMMDAKGIAALAKQHGVNQTKLTTTQETNELKSQVAKLKPEQRDDRAIRLMQAQDQGQPLTQDDQAYLKAYAQWVNQTKVQPGIARAAAYGQFRPLQYVDDAGNVHYMFSGDAIKQGVNSPQSMNFRTATAMSKFMTSGKGGQTITAYNTANDHLDLLSKAMDALDNGNVQALNQLNNAFKKQFGQAAPTNVNAVKAMLAGELANVAKVTGATDPEIQEQRENINRAASPEQIRGFIETNHDLLDQKAYEMFQQYQQGEKGQPAFSTGLTGRGPQSAAPQTGTEPPRPANVPKDYEFQENGPNGRGWYKPKGGK